MLKQNQEPESSSGGKKKGAKKKGAHADEDWGEDGGGGGGKKKGKKGEKKFRVRLQWDPDHLPDGERHVYRKAVQLGLKKYEGFVTGMYM
jgi:hypothetical protein